MDGISAFKQFLYLHKPQLESSGIPSHFWQTIYKKLTNQIFDAGDAFSLFLIDYSDSERKEQDPIWTVAISKPDGLSANDPTAVYIVDHAWSFRLDMARNQLRQMPQLLNRMCIIMGIDTENINENAEQCVDQVLKSMWKYSQMYSLAGNNELTVEERLPIWYVLDELGCGINHSDTPNFRIVPFMFMAEHSTYSLLFPIVDCDEGDYVTRDFVENTPKNSRLRNALLLPWRYSSFMDVDFKQIEPDAQFFLDGHLEESLPSIELNVESTAVPNNHPLKVFTTYRYIREYLNDPSFVIVDSEEEADILWLTTHFKNYNEFSLNNPQKFINQFPFENVLTIKDLLSIICRRTESKRQCTDNNDETLLKTFPNWLPTTYNLKTELLEFVSYYQHRKQANIDNHWIIKPWNLARGLDMHITNSIEEIMRLQPTGPKIAQKYIENPVLFYRSDINGKVKFDVRYVILLKSVDPLDVYIYTNFFLRFANKPFQLDTFDDYQKHFTVMNYANDFNLRHIPCAEFLSQWSEQSEHSWKDIELNIKKMLKEVFIGATAKEPPCGIGKSPQSRALYAVDLMLAWDDDDKIQPKILEINWTPDCQRACEYYPDFYNDIFRLLFLNEMNDNVFQRL